LICCLGFIGCGRGEVPPAVHDFAPTCGEPGSSDQWARVQTLSGADWEHWDLDTAGPNIAGSFGGNVSLRPTTLLVGAASADAHRVESGAVYLYGDSPRVGTWIPNGRLTAARATQGGRFGRTAVSTSGTIAIAAPGEGSVYLYRMGGNQRWELDWQLENLRLGGARTNLAYDGGVLFVGRPGAHMVSAYDTAAAAGAPEVWSADAPADDHRWGVTVVQDGDVLAVGDDWYPQVGGDDGAVTIFERGTDGTWVERQLLTQADAGYPTGAFGASLAVVGDRVFVGSPADADDGFGVGSVYVFRRVGGVWTLEQRLHTPRDEYYNWSYFHFGSSLAASGSTLVVGAPQCRTPSARMVGCVSVYRLEGDVWTRVAKLYPPESTEGSEYGASVALCGDRLVVGAPGVERAFVYEQQ
jgi:hypothetical protein